MDKIATSNMASDQYMPAVQSVGKGLTNAKFIKQKNIRRD